MKVQLEKLEKSEMKVSIELTKEAMDKYRKQAAKLLQDQVKVEGFRPGKIPMDVLIKKVGEQAFMGQVLDVAISDSYEEAVKKEGVRPVAYPKINVIEQDPLKFEAVVAVLPEVEWSKDIAKLTLKREKVEIKEAEIKEVLENLKTRSTKWKEVDRKAKDKDRVEIDFDGLDMEGKALEGTSSKNHPLILGGSSFIPGFEDEVLGMKKDEEKDFEITFPKDYHADHFKGKKVKFHVKVHMVEEPEEPKLDDEFAKEITGGNRKNMDELKEEIKTELGFKKEMDEDSRLESVFLKELIGFVKADVPAALVERETDFMVERIKEDVEKQKMDWEDYKKEMESKGKDMRAELKKPAEEQVLIRLGLEKLHSENKTEVAEKEIEAEIAKRTEHYPPQFKPMVLERYKEGGQERDFLKSQLMLRKVVQKHTK